jgi:hypothetical protein
MPYQIPNYADHRKQHTQGSQERARAHKLLFVSILQKKCPNYVEIGVGDLDI